MTKIFKSLCSLIAGVMLVFGIASCDKKDTDTTETSSVDYTSELKLTASFEGKDFVTNGIGEVTLATLVDGDTSYFYSNGHEVKIRYLSIDTPESTGTIEPYGKAASRFTASKLSAATSIVLQANGDHAELDSTSSRYLGFIWYKTAQTTDYRLLNLELVQNGYSKANNAAKNLYASEITSAASQARANKLVIWSGENDPEYYYGGAIELTIKQMLSTPLEYKGKKVRFTATVSRVDGMYYYLEEIDAETQVHYAILCYPGYGKVHTNKLTTVGNTVILTGILSEYNGQYQITSINDIAGSTSLDNIQVVPESDKIIITPNVITAQQLNDMTNTALSRTLVQLNNIVVKSMYTTTNEDSNSKGAITITGTVDGVEVTIRTSVLYEPNYGPLITEEYFEGHASINVVGIVDTYNDKYQIQLVSSTDVTFND